MNMKKIINIFLIFIILFSAIMSSVNADYTASLDENNVRPTDTLILDITVITNPQRGDPYTAIWYDNASNLLETDVGTLSNILLGTVTETYITSSNSSWINAYVNVTSGGVTTQLYFNVTGNSSNSIIITDCDFSPIARIGEIFAVDCLVKDINDNELNNAECSIFGSGTDDSPLQLCTKNADYVKSHSGRIECGDTLTNVFDESLTYLTKIRCTCGQGQVFQCSDIDGNIYQGYEGEAVFPFIIEPYLESVNTITDASSYDVQTLITICANITNAENESRRDLGITYSYRCDSGSDTNSDRSLIGEYYEKRGIDSNLTQFQCHSFTIPNFELIEKGSTECYASTDVDVFNEQKIEVYHYLTISPDFNITILGIHPELDWIRSSSETYYTIINLTDYNVGVKEIHAIINPLLDIEGTPATTIKSFDTKYINGTIINGSYIFVHQHQEKFDGNIKFDNDIEISIPNINTTLNPLLNVSITVSELNNVGDNMNWFTVIFALGLMTVMFAVFSFKIQDERLNWAKLLMFLLGIINVFLIGMIPYLITINPNSVSTFEPVALGYLSVNGGLMIYFIWMYGSHLFLNYFKDQAEEQEKRNKSDKL